MMAILRYALVKSVRDGSGVAFILAPIIAAVGSLISISLDRGYANWSAMQKAEFTAMMGWFVAVVFASMSSFWIFRSEIGSRSIGAFLLATRPLSVATALILFGTAVGIVGTLLAAGAIAALTAAIPRHLLLLVLKSAVGCFAAAAIGALAVMISSQPAMIIATYVSCVFIIPLLAKPPTMTLVLVLVVAAMVCAALSAFLLERRCAT